MPAIWEYFSESRSLGSRVANSVGCRCGLVRFSTETHPKGTAQSRAVSQPEVRAHHFLHSWNGYGSWRVLGSLPQSTLMPAPPCPVTAFIGTYETFGTKRGFRSLPTQHSFKHHT